MPDERTPSDPPRRIVFGATKPSLDPQWLAEQLGASEVVELPESVRKDPTGQKRYEYYMESRGFKKID